MSRDKDFPNQAQQIMDFRQSVVAELANPYLPYGEIARLIKDKASMRYEMPWSTKSAITEGTIRKWLETYRQFGKEGLRPHSRADRGKSRAITKEDEQTFVEFLRANPALTAINAWRKLYREGKLSMMVSTSTLSRLVKAHSLERERRLADQANEQSLKFQFFYPLECVQADCLHGPTIPGANGKPAKAILIAFIDDATRRIVYASFTNSEHSLAFEKGIRHILDSQGRIVRLYVDNGSSFVSSQTQRILDTLQIHLIHSTVRRPQGRGKIERFFRTVRDSFLRVLDVGSIASFEDLNMRFRTWLESEYHRSPHRGLPEHQSPLECWNDKARHIVPMDSSIDLDKVFYHECYRRVGRDQTVTIDSILFEAPAVLIGNKVTLRYDPHKSLRTVEAWCDGKNYGECRVVDSYANSLVKRNSITEVGKDGKSGNPQGSIQAGLAASQWSRP